VWAVSLDLLRYNRRFSQRPIESCLSMEINPILNSIKDLSDRTLSIRGYL